MPGGGEPVALERLEGAGEPPASTTGDRARELRELGLREDGAGGTNVPTSSRALLAVPASGVLVSP